MRTLAIIPARGGSKRIPGKNLADVGGRSLLEHAVYAGRECDEVVVSTDDGEIADAARRLDPYLHHRKPEHATDDAQLEPVIADVLAQVERIPEAPFDAIVLLQPTSPLRTAAHVAEALAILRETGCDSVVSVTRLHSLHPVFNGWVCDTSAASWSGTVKSVREGVYEPHVQNGPRPASAALSSLVYENGAVYAFTRAHWERTGSRMGGDMRALVMHWSEAVDIDEPADLDAARRLAR